MSTGKAQGNMLQIHAERLVRSCSDLASLKTPATMRADLREEVIAEAGLGMAIDSVVAAGEVVFPAGNARPLHAIMAVIINRGRENGMSLGDLFETINAAFQDAAVARAEEEAQREKVAEELAKR